MFSRDPASMRGSIFQLGPASSFITLGGSFFISEGEKLMADDPAEANEPGPGKDAVPAQMIVLLAFYLVVITSLLIWGISEMAGLRCSMRKSRHRQSASFNNPNADPLTHYATESLTEPDVITKTITITICDVTPDATHNRGGSHCRIRFSKVGSDGLQYSSHNQRGKF